MSSAGPSGDGLFSSLGCGALGINPGFDAAVDLAARHGFGGVDPDGGHLRKLGVEEAAAVGQRVRDRGLRWGSAGMPVDLTGTAAKFASGLAALPAYAETLHAAGVDRAHTWMRPMSDTLTYRRNFRRYAERVALVGEILGSAGLRFGLEYVGPKTFWSTERHPFVHTLGELLELLEEVGDPNVGVVLDTFHWYTAGESVEDILALSPEQVVAVDVNDAPTGLKRDEQQDLSRMLPATTGVIDVAGFVGALRRIGYAGPVKVEPFNAELKALPVEEVVATTAASLREALA